MPFANIGGHPEQEHFVDGVTESLTTDLSRIRGAYVVARNTAFTYNGKPLDVKTIGRELNVRYVLEGSVQRGGNRMRVNVQLIDAETGNHLWAERFDKPLADLFDMQDEIVARLAGALNAQLVAAEARRAEQAPSPDSMDLYFQGLAWFNKGRTPDNVAQARSFFDRALSVDPMRRQLGVEVRVFSGASGGVTAPTKNFVPVTMVEIRLDRGASVRQDLPADYNAVGAEAKFVTAGDVAWLTRGGSGEASEVAIRAKDKPLRALLHAGRPLHEAVVARGPFVMNTEAEIKQAYADYRAGRFGPI